MWIPTIVTEQLKIDKFYSFFEKHYDNGFNFPGESHDFWECIYVIDGNICVSADDRVYYMKKGDIIFHKPLEFHKFYVDNEDGATLLIFSFSLFGEASVYLENKVYILDDLQKEILSSMILYIKSEMKNINIPRNTKFHQRYIVLFKEINIYSQMITTYIYQLLLLLTKSKNISNVIDSADAKIFSKCVYYMKKNIDNKISVKDISKQSCVSETSIKRIFRKYAGISVHKYFLSLKLNKSMELMSKGYNVTEVAQKLGFSNQANFSTVYKREMGYSPSDFNKK